MSLDILPGAVPDRHQRQAGHQGQGKVVSSLPGFPRQVPRSGRRSPLLGDRAHPTPVPATIETPRQSNAPHHGGEGGSETPEVIRVLWPSAENVGHGTPGELIEDNGT